MLELRRAQEKEACGVSGFLTQPVLSAEALDNLKLAHKTLRGKILGGIFPRGEPPKRLFSEQ